jgi:nucleoid DNA-binding protein
LKVTLASLKELLRNNPSIKGLSTYSINHVVDTMVDTIVEQITLGNTVSIVRLMTLQPRLKPKKHFYDVNARKLRDLPEHYGIRVMLSRKLMSTVAKIPAPKRLVPAKSVKPKVSKK